MELEYAGCAYPVEGLGPGKRLAMWVYGCARHCAGCISPELQPHGTPWPLPAVIADLQSWLPLADGLSISGGEPFAQAAALADLIRELRAQRDLEVLLYTGYLLEELRDRADAAELLALCDLLIDGPFLQAAANTLQWRGSDNQRVHFSRSVRNNMPGCRRRRCPNNARCRCRCSARRGIASSASRAAGILPHTAPQCWRAAWR